MLSLYTTEKIISAIVSNSEGRYDIWLDFIKKLRVSLKVLLDDDSDYDFNDSNPINLLGLEGEVIDFIEKTDLNQIIELKSDVIRDSQVIFLLDIAKDTATNISKKYGVICCSLKDSSSDNPLFRESLELNLECDEKNNWNKLLSQDCISPSNALIFIDRYLFSKDSNSICCQDGINNVSDILNEILPPALGVEFHILLIFDDSKIEPGSSFKDVSTAINKLKKKLNRPYPIAIEALSLSGTVLNGTSHYRKTHNRRIISNYFIIRADHSLKAFRNCKSIYDQTLQLDWIASKGIVRSKKSDAPGKDIYNIIKGLQEAIHDLKKDIGNIAFSQNGDCKKSLKEIKNRLITDCIL